jgi:hypothetical protein
METNLVGEILFYKDQTRKEKKKKEKKNGGKKKRKKPKQSAAPYKRASLITYIIHGRLTGGESATRIPLPTKFAFSVHTILSPTSYLATSTISSKLLLDARFFLPIEIPERCCGSSHKKKIHKILGER